MHDFRKTANLFLLTPAIAAFSVHSALAQSVLNLLEQEIGQLVLQARPAVITVSAVGAAGMSQKTAEGLLSFWSESENTAPVPRIRVGSGLVITSDGFIVTRYSVVESAKEVFVTLQGNRRYQAEVVGSDSLASIALLRVNAPNLQPAQLGIVENMAPGSWIVVIGNSMGIPHSVSVGIVNGIQQDGMMRVSASVDPGHSGSPVFNSRGEAIGLVAAVVNYEKEEGDARSSGAFGHSTLVWPISFLLPPLRQLIDDYYGQHGWIGVTVNRDPQDQQGARVVRLEEGGPGKKAGMRVDDTITHFGGQPLKGLAELRDLVQQLKPGDRVEVGLLRQATPVKIAIEIGRRRGDDVLRIASPTTVGARATRNVRTQP